MSMMVETDEVRRVIRQYAVVESLVPMSLCLVFCFVDGDQLGRHVNEMPLFLSSRYPCSFARTQAEVTPSSSGTNLSSHGSADIRISQGLDHRLERLGH